MKPFFYKSNKSNLGEPQLIADTGDNSADGNDLADAAETMGSEGSGDLLG